MLCNIIDRFPKEKKKKEISTKGRKKMSKILQPCKGGKLLEVHNYCCYIFFPKHVSCSTMLVRNCMRRIDAHT